MIRRYHLLTLLAVVHVSLSSVQAAQGQNQSCLPTTFKATAKGARYLKCLQHLSDLTAQRGSSSSSHSAVTAANNEKGAASQQGVQSQPLAANATAQAVSKRPIVDPAMAEYLASSLSDDSVAQFCQIVHHPLSVEILSKTGPNSLTAMVDKAIACHQQALAGIKAFATPFQYDAKSGLYLPHPAEYCLTDVPWHSHVNDLMDGYGSVPGVIDPYFKIDGDQFPLGNTRSNCDAVAKLIQDIHAQQKEVLNVEIACQKKMQEGTWKGSWSGEGACNPPAWSGATTSMSGTFETQAGKDDCLEDVKTQKAELLRLEQILEKVQFLDNLVNGAETQAAYENVLKVMDNQVRLWNKMENDKLAVEALIDQRTAEIIAAIQKLTNVPVTDLANLINTNTQRLSEEVAGISQKVDNAVATLATQNCDVKNRVADVQRETNYLRYLMLTPDKKRPDHKASADDCTLSQPEYCGIALTERPPRPVVFAPPTTCSIRDGSQVLDLNGDDVFTENRLTPP